MSWPIFIFNGIMDSNLADTYSVMANVYVEIGENESAKGTFNRSIEILSKSSEKLLETERGNIFNYKTGFDFNSQMECDIIFLK